MDLARALAEDPPVRWIIGRVKQVTGDTITMTYKGGDVTNVAVLDHYVPKVGDVVHVLSSDQNGMVALGSNNQSTTPPAPVTPRAPITVASTSVATYRLSTGAWTAGVLQESPDHIGCWFYPGFGTVVNAGVLPLARLTIRVTAQSAVPLEFILHSSSGATGVPVAIASYRVAAPLLLTPTDVPLPLDWGQKLISGAALGVGVGDGDYTALLTGSSGLLTFTPLL